MNVRQLIKLLEQEDAEAQVHFAYNYGDHWHTIVAPEVTDVDEGYVVYSSYHDMTKLVDNTDPPANATVVVVLS